MTDDFQLFQDEEGGDPDIALITAYLARELSLVQIVAVEERLATDAAFREKVRPVIEAWALPGSLAGKRRLAAPAGETSLTRAEIEQGWQRYVAERAEVAPGAPSRPIRLHTATTTGRKRSMTRIAAGIAAVLLPVVTLAQAAMYAAKHEDAPGHAVAKRIIAPFVADVPAPPVPPETTRLQPPADARIGRELEKAPESVQRAPETAAVVPSAGQTPAAVVPAEPATQVAQAVTPDRAKIAGLATKHHPHVVRGDTAVDYMVMVLDASGNYVWSTYGVGTVSIQIAGDKRTAAERAQLVRDNRVEYSGTMTGGSGGAMTGVGRGARVGGGGGSGGTVRAIAPDSVPRVRVDSSGARAVLRMDSMSMTRTRAAGRGGSGGGAGGAVAGGIITIDSSLYRQLSTARPAPLGSGVWITGVGPDSTSGVYRIGWGRVARINEAPGLQEPGGVQSGIQGLMAASITAGETYTFTPGQLSPRLLRIAVIHLARGTSWNGR